MKKIDFKGMTIFEAEKKVSELNREDRLSIQRPQKPRLKRGADSEEVRLYAELLASWEYDNTKYLKEYHAQAARHTERRWQLEEFAKKSVMVNSNIPRKIIEKLWNHVVYESDNIGNTVIEVENIMNIFEPAFEPSEIMEILSQK